MVDALIIVLAENITKNPAFSEIVALAISKGLKLILIHPYEVQFPSQQDIDGLEPIVKRVFDTVAISYTSEFVDDCWEKICDKLYDREPQVHFLPFAS